MFKTTSTQHPATSNKLTFLTLLTLLYFLIFLSPLSAQLTHDQLFKDFTYRNLGAFRTGSWVADIAAPEKPDEANRYTFYVAARAGGVWKTTNNGTTFECISDALGVNSIGVVEVAPSDPNLIWIGTGEAFNARSSYAGNGIYKSTDGGLTWQDKGLKDSHHINRILIHPENPDIVYVAVMGHLFSDNEERGVFKSINGGDTWEKVLYINEKIGVIDLCMNRQNPDILYAASYEKVRTAWTYEPGGPGSRIYKTSDGGKNWRMLTKGLPGGDLGRIGIDVHRANPDILYAVIQNLNPDPDFDSTKMRGFNAYADNTYDAMIGGEVYRSEDAGENWVKTSDKETDVSGKAGYSFNQLYADPINPDHVYIVGVSMYYSHDGGKTWPMGWREKDRFMSNFGDVRSFWIDPEDNRHMMLGSDGGIYSTWDAGLTMFHYYHLPTEEVYHVEVDQSEPYNIYVGLQDHETWKGPSNSWSGSVGQEEWVITGMWDGMYTKVDYENNRWLYCTTQFGSHLRVDQLSGDRVNIAPKQPDGEAPYRYTWTTPLEMSPHNPAILYTGGEHLLRTIDRGEHWEEISQDLTTNDPNKINGKGHMQHCTISTISESPLKAGVIWVGTDDGKVQLTTNHGAEWTDLTPALVEAGAPELTWVSRIKASSHHLSVAYMTKSGFREDVFKPFVYVTRDLGKTWTPITRGLPDAPVSVIFEDQQNPDLLYVGTDRGVYVSFDGGMQWTPFFQNMPPVPVRDLLVHPREKDLVVATYGRGTFITDVSPLAEINDSLLNERFHLFNIAARPIQFDSPRASWGNYHMMGDNHLSTPNEPGGVEIFYYLKESSTRDELEVAMTDAEGRRVASQKLKPEAGLHKIYLSGRRLEPGTYKVLLTLGKTTITRDAKVLPAPVYPVGRISPETAK